MPRTEGEDEVDDSNDLKFMEMDVRQSYTQFVSKLSWKYEDLESPLVEPTTIYEGPGPCLREGVQEKFNAVFECANVCGGLDYLFYKRLTTNSNIYAQTNKKPTEPLLDIHGTISPHRK